VVPNNARDGRSTKVFELGRETVLNDRTDLLSEKDLLRSVGPCSSLLSAQVFEKFGISRHLLDGINEWQVDFYLFEDLHHILYFLSLFPELRMCLETFWEWGLGLIWYLKSGSGLRRSLSVYLLTLFLLQIIWGLCLLILLFLHMIVDSSSTLQCGDG
jgi:hypothetical protein